MRPRSFEFFVDGFEFGGERGGPFREVDLKVAADLVIVRPVIGHRFAVKD